MLRDQTLQLTIAKRGKIIVLHFALENNLPNKEIKDITEITEDEEEINNILDKLVSNMVMCNFEDIVNDLVKTRLCAY